MYRAALRGPSDDPARIAELGVRYGLAAGPEAGYVGHGQGRSPRRWIEALRTDFGWSRRMDPAALDDVCARLADLPDQDAARPDPVYRLAVLTKR